MKMATKCDNIYASVHSDKPINKASNINFQIEILLRQCEKEDTCLFP